MMKAAEQYQLRVKRSLFCGKADRDRLLGRLAEMLDDFQQAGPEADYAEYAATFGEPAACAAELLSSLGESKFEAIQKRRLWVRRGVYAAVLAVLVLLSAFLYWRYRQSLYFNKDTVLVIESVIEVPKDVVDTMIEQAPMDARAYGGK
ncbi:MAG: hypothetical protein HFG00_01455 [Oscillibacter sp.]|nr:hypothetical protein [Oscillibacter sp.]